MLSIGWEWIVIKMKCSSIWPGDIQEKAFLPSRKMSHIEADEEEEEEKS